MNVGIVQIIAIAATPLATYARAPRMSFGNWTCRFSRAATVSAVAALN